MIAILTFLFIGIHLMQNNVLNLGELIVAIVLLSSSFGPVVALSNLSNNLIQTFACAQRVFDILDEVPAVEDVEGETELSSKDIKVDNISFDYDNRENILKDLSLDIKKGDKVAIIGTNGVGKTTLLKQIFKNNNDAIKIDENIKLAYLSQMQSEVVNESNTILQEFYDVGFETYGEIRRYLGRYGFSSDILTQKIESLSGGEKNILQLAKVSASKANMLLMDEPTSHLDIYSQMALEKAISNYKGAILMISHDYHFIVNCADYVLLIEDKTIRKMSMRKFRKMIYANHFDKDYLQIEKKKKALEMDIASALRDTDFERARSLSEKLEEIIKSL